MMRSAYHRTNGITKTKFRFNASSAAYSTYTVPTEGYIGTMNYLNNKYILERVGENFTMPKIIPAISVSIDSS